MSADTHILRHHIPLRVGAGVLGGYVFTWGFVALGISLLTVLGLSFDDAWSLTMMLAFLVFLTVLCWAFAAADVAQVWIMLTGGGAMMTGAAWLVSRFLI